ncbi:hypothetical protein IFM89_024486, partial [Coptis chinensis]
DAIGLLSVNFDEEASDSSSSSEILCYRPGTVSCADIVALAARDSVSYQVCALHYVKFFILKISYCTVVSLAAGSALMWFHQLHLDACTGSHTIGVGHCSFFSNGLYNFTGKGDSDPSLNSTYAAFLKTKCRSLSDNTTTVPMEPQTPLSFDNNYYSNLKQHKGMFQSDASLLTEEGPANIVDEMLVPGKFFVEFRQSMKRMGTIGVLTDNSGEIRKKCSVVNS